MDIGQILYEARKTRRLSQEKLCNGICSVANYSKYESNQLIPDFFSFIFLFERLGIDSTTVTAYMGKGDITYWKWKNVTSELAGLGKFEELKHQFSREPKRNVSLNQNLVLQYRYYLQGILFENVKHDYEEATKMYLAAIKCSCAGILEDYLLNCYGKTEIGLAILYLHSRVLAQKDIKNEVAEHAYRLLQYVQSQEWDHKQFVSVYAQLVVLWVKNDNECNVLEQKYFCLKSAYEMIKETKINYEVIYVLVYLMQVGNMLGINTDRYKNEKNMFINLYAFFNISYNKNGYKIYDDTMMVVMIGDYLKKVRKELNYTQETIADGICAVESYSRIENGRNVSKKKLDALGKKMGIDIYAYRDVLKAENKMTKEARNCIRKAINERCFEKAHHLLENLKEKVNKPLDEEDIAYFSSTEALLKYHLKEYDMEQYYHVLCSLLDSAENVRVVINQYHRFHLTEMRIVERICFIESQKGNICRSISYLEEMLHNIESDQYTGEFFQFILIPIKLQLGRYYMDMNEVEKARGILLEGIRTLLEKNHLENLEYLISEVGYSFLQDSQDLGKKYLSMAYQIADFLENKNFVRMIERTNP